MEAKTMNGTDGGWIKLHRRFLRSAIWQNPNVARFWTWCLLKATHAPITQMVGIKKISLEPGQFLYNHPTASIETGLSQKVVRNCLECLKNGDDPEIGQAEGSLPGRRFSIITILKWDAYQNTHVAEGRLGAGKRAGKGQARGSLINKEDKNIKKQGAESDPIDVIWNGVSLEVPDVLMVKYRKKYPTLDIPSIIIDAERWLLKYPKKAAGYKSFDLFLNNWFRGEADKQRSVAPVDDYVWTPEQLAVAQAAANAAHAERN